MLLPSSDFISVKYSIIIHLLDDIGANKQKRAEQNRDRRRLLYYTNYSTLLIDNFRLILYDWIETTTEMRRLVWRRWEKEGNETNERKRGVICTIMVNVILKSIRDPSI